MKHININRFLNHKSTGNMTILIVSILIVYLFIALYFTNHFFFNTVINGLDVSLKAHDDLEDLMESYIKDYKLQIVERNMEVEEITAQDVGMKYNVKNSISQIYTLQSSFKWIGSLLKNQEHYVDDLFVYSKDNLESRINRLNCLNKEFIEPQNVSFRYSNGSYETVREVYGNKVNKDKLVAAIKSSVLRGESKLDLNKNLCYENPKYTIGSDKTSETKNTLNKYVSTKITYMFGSENEVLDGDIISQWLDVNEDLEVLIDEKAVLEYVQKLGKKYDTVGAARRFKTSINKVLEVKGGFYGWKINRLAEAKAILESIKLSEVTEKEPIYTQKAITRGKDDIGDSYVEINLTRQYLWFYKDGKLITQGPVVTGDPNKGNATDTGVYMLNYKEKESTLRGAGYEVEVTYWMPFNGHIGIHDASWRYFFGGSIYKGNGSHGCVNAPLYLAKKIFEYIEEGTPIICYEE